MVGKFAKTLHKKSCCDCGAILKVKINAIVNTELSVSILSCYIIIREVCEEKPHQKLMAGAGSYSTVEM